MSDTKYAGGLQKLLADATPGPWSIAARLAPDGTAYTSIGGGDWISFAWVWARMEHEDSDSPEGLANARLIAMAPDLAAALILAKEALEWYGEQARVARLVHSEGDAGRHNLTDDGGRKSRDALDAINKLEGAYDAPITEWASNVRYVPADLLADMTRQRDELRNLQHRYAESHPTVNKEPSHD